MPGDEAAIGEVNRRAFGREVEARLVDLIRESDGFIPGLSLVAEQDGEIIGHIMYSTIAIEQAETRIPALVLAPVAVRPEWQRRGIGSALIREGLARARDLGHRVVILFGHPNYYPRFGFQPASRFGLTCRFPAPDDAFMALALAPGALDAAQGVVVFPRALTPE